MTHLELTVRDPAAIPTARDALTRAAAARGPDMSRSRAFELSDQAAHTATADTRDLAQRLRQLCQAQTGP